MKTGKKILLISIAVLAVIYALQLAFMNRSTAKTFKLKDKITSLTIEKGDETILLTLEGGLWYVGKDKLAAEDEKVVELINAVSNIKTLQTVSRSNADAELERYGLADVTTMNVTAKKDDKTVRTIKIGKNAAGSISTYIQLDGSSETMLATGSLRSKFDVKEESLKHIVEEKPAEEVPSPETQDQLKEASVK